MPNRSAKGLVPRRDPLAPYGGKVPVGKIPPGMRPASTAPAVRTRPAASPRPDHTSLEDLVSAGHGYFDDTSAAAALTITTDRLDVLIDAGLVLALRTGEGQRVIPTWQIHDGAVLPFLSDVVRALRTGLDDDWTIALWLTAPMNDRGQSAADLLAAGADPRPILTEACRDAARWSH